MVIHYFTVRLEKVQLSRVRTNSSVATSLEDSIPRGIPPMPPSGGVIFLLCKSDIALQTEQLYSIRLLNSRSEYHSAQAEYHCEAI